MDSLIPFCDELCQICDIPYNNIQTSQWRRNKALMHSTIKKYCDNGNVNTNVDNNNKDKNNSSSSGGGVIDSTLEDSKNGKDSDIIMSASTNNKSDINTNRNTNTERKGQKKIGNLRFGKSFELNKYPKNQNEFENKLKYHSIWYPFVIKPPTAGGTDGVRLVFNYIGASKVIKKYLYQKNSELNMNNTLMIQEYLNGIEFVVNCVSHNGKHRLSDMWQSFKSLDCDTNHMTLKLSCFFVFLVFLFVFFRCTFDFALLSFF